MFGEAPFAADAFIKRVGVGKASVFKGFCNKHDSDTFSPIEDEPLTVGSANQALLFGLRAECLEAANKRTVLVKYRHMADGLNGLIPHERLKDLKAQWAGADLYMKREAPYYLRIYFSSLSGELIEPVRYRWIVGGSNIGVSLSCVFCPWLDEYSTRWKPDLDHPQPSVTYSIVPEEQRTHFILTWPASSDDAMSDVVKKIDTSDNLTHLLNRFAFAESEDFAITPSLWESLSSEMKRRVADAVMHWSFRGPLAWDEMPIIFRLRKGDFQVFGG